MRVYISRFLYGASNHIIILTKKSFRKKISICKKCLSAAIFTAPQKCPPRRENYVDIREEDINKSCISMHGQKGSIHSSFHLKSAFVVFLGETIKEKTPQLPMIQNQHQKQNPKNSKMISRLVDVYVTSECILLCILRIVTRCSFRDVSIMYLSHVVMPRCSDRED